MERPRIRDYFSQNLAENQQITPKQRAILQASLDLFAEKGFDQTSTSDIAQRAGVAEGTVYRRYKTKAALREAVLAPIVDQIVPVVASDFSQTELTLHYASLHDFLAAIYDDRLAFVLANQKELKVIFEMIAFDKAQQQRIITTVGLQMVHQVSTALDALRANGWLVDWPNDLVMQTILSMLGGYFIRLILEVPGTDFEREKRYLVGAMTKLLTPSEHDDLRL